MSYQQAVNRAAEYMFDEMTGYTLEQHAGPILIEYLLQMREYSIDDNPQRTKYHSNGIDIYHSTADNNHAIEFTTDSSKDPADDYQTVKRDNRSVDVYWFVTPTQKSDPSFPDCPVSYEGVGLDSLFEMMELKSSSTSALNTLLSFADLTGYDFDRAGSVNLNLLTNRSFNCQISIYPPHVAMWPERFHREVIRKLKRASESLRQQSGVGGLRDFIHADTNNTDIYHIEIDAQTDTINLDLPGGPVNPAPNVTDPIEVDLSDEVDKLFIPIRVRAGDEQHPQHIEIEPIDRLSG
jgi:hypothetical protein